MTTKQRPLVGWTWIQNTAAKYRMTAGEFLRSEGPLPTPKKRRRKR